MRRFGVQRRCQRPARKRVRKMWRIVLSRWWELDSIHSSEICLPAFLDLRLRRQILGGILVSLSSLASLLTLLLLGRCMLDIQYMRRSSCESNIVGRIWSAKIAFLALNIGWIYLNRICWMWRKGSVQNWSTHSFLFAGLMVLQLEACC